MTVQCLTLTEASRYCLDENGSKFQLQFYWSKVYENLIHSYPYVDDPLFGRVYRRTRNISNHDIFHVNRIYKQVIIYVTNTSMKDPFAGHKDITVPPLIPLYSTGAQMTHQFLRLVQTCYENYFVLAYCLLNFLMISTARKATY